VVKKERIEKIRLVVSENIQIWFFKFSEEYKRFGVIKICVPLLRPPSVKLLDNKPDRWEMKLDKLA
jgi:hypothetical protein